MESEDKIDMLGETFRLQESFMEELREADRFPEWPVDLTTKPGQRLAKEIVFNLTAELHEATAILKNKMHRMSDDRTLDIDHYIEELGDAYAFFIELCIVSGISSVELFNEYKRKNAIVHGRLKEGY